MFPIWAPDSNVFAYLSNKNNDFFGSRLKNIKKSNIAGIPMPITINEKS